MTSPHQNESSTTPLFRVAASFTADPIEEYLKFWIPRLHLERAEISIAGYNQLFQELLNPASPSLSQDRGINFFLLRLEDALRMSSGEGGRGTSGRLDQVRRVTLELLDALQTFASKARRPSIVLLCPPAQGSEADPSLRQSLHLAYDECQRSLSQLPGITVVTAEQVAEWYPVTEIHDSESDLQGHVPYTQEYFAALGAALMRSARVILQPPTKAIIVDADNTLWSGVVGEVGETGISLSHSRLALQRRLRDLKNRGVLLALASKNEPLDVRAAFSRPEMILQESDFSGWKVAWQPKSESIRQLAAEWSLSPDSFVFIDDNPMECAEVRAAFPNLLAVELPADESSIMPVIDHCWALDLPAATATDATRAAMMQQQSLRQAEAANAGTFAEFINGLQLEATFRSPSPEDIPRVAQLTQRTNQFNATGVRRTEVDVAAALAREDCHALLLHVKDRFGDYGDVGLALYRVRGQLVFVENFLLSCRVLGKGVEHELLAELGEAAHRHGCLGIVLPFRPTPRNQPVANFLQELCADGFKDGNYHFPVHRARQVKFDPNLVATPISASNDAAATDVITRPDFAFIAHHFQSAASIVSAVAAARRRTRPVLANRAVPPETPRQETLAAIWGDVLQVDPIGIHDSFTDLGGQSLYATRIVSAIARTFSIRLPLTALFTHPTIALLSEHMDAMGQKLESSLELPTTGGNEISPPEQRLWFLDQFITHRAAYNIPTARRLRGNLRPEALESAFQNVCSRHAMLRTSFPAQDGKPAHKTSNHGGTAWQYLTAADESAAQAIAQTDAIKPFSLADGPLVRGLLIRLATDDHLLFVNFHHIISDGWSVSIFYHDLAFAYQSAQRNRQPLWPKLEGTCAGFARLTNARIQRGDFQADLDHWKQQLSKAPTILQLPTDRPHPPVRQYTGAVVEGVVNASIGKAIASIAQKSQTTPFVVLAATFQVMLHRISGQEELLLGTPVSGRTHPSVQQVIGCFVNTVVLRSRYQAEQTFNDYLRDCRETVVGALEHQDLPFENLVDSLSLPRDLSHTPLVQTMFVLQDSAGRDFAAPGIKCDPVQVHNQGAKFDLVLEATPHGDGYAMVLEYNSAVLHEGTAKRWLKHYITLLESSSQAPSKPLHQLALLTSEEQTEMIHGFNGNQKSFNDSLCLHRWFEGIAARTPQEMALTCDGVSLTYSETNLRANQLAHVLIREGVGPETLVGICIDRSLDLVVALLAILKAGAAYLPIDLSYPAERLSFMLQDAEAPILLTQRKLSDRLPRHGARTLFVDDSENFSTAPDYNPTTEVTADNTAYVIFTSGSTGLPKGCLVTHRNVTRLMQATEAWYGFDSTDVWTLFHSTAFDFSVWELWGALLYGGRLVVVPYHASRSPEEFYQLLSRERVTVLNQTPSAFRQLIAAEEACQEPASLMLRYVIFGGEALEMQSLKPWFDRHGDRQPQLVNMYGITETTVHVTYRPISANDLNGGSVIGIPIPDLQVYILDSHLHPVPIGVPGEMYVGGAGLARGYLKRPELTAQRFIPDQLSGRANGRLYKTGDLARFLPGRDIEYLGRIDQQVKIRGFRIELGEIESALVSHPAVKEAAVIPREDAPGEKRLVAYLVPHGDAPHVDVLRKHLQVNLPDYMVPAAFVMMEQFPLTGNGKLDRAALPEPEIDRDLLSKEYVAPRNDAETRLVAIWAKVLKVPRVGVHDNFFELGGDSILSIHMIAQARKTGFSFTPRQLFENQTVAQLALLPESASVAAPSVRVSLDNVPLLPIQRWFFEQSLADSHFWNQAFLFSVSERLNRDTLRQAASMVVKKHEALRLRFHKLATGWKQSVVDIETSDFVEFHDLIGYHNGKLAARVQEISQSVQRQLNYEHGPLIRFSYLDLGEDRPGRLIIAAHHLAVDGVSWGIILADFEAACRNESLPEVPVSFAQAAAQAEAWSNSSSASLEKSWWAGRLPATVAPLLRIELNEGPNMESSTETVSFQLTPEETRALLQQVPAAFRTRMNDVLLSALLLAVQRTLQRQGLWLNLEGHGREDVYGDADLSRTVGWFTALFPVQLTAPSDADLPTLLRSVRDQLRSIPQNGAGFGFLRYSDTSPLPASGADLVFNYLGRLDQLTDASDLLAIAPESTGAWHSPFALRQHRHEIDCYILRDQFQLDWKFSRNLHREATIQPLMQAIATALREIIALAQQGIKAQLEPADFPLVRLGQPEIDRLATLLPGVVDILPLSPMQELFYGAAAAKVNAGYDQWHSRLVGNLDVPSFQAAWEQVLQRHGILRSSFHSIGLTHPVQVVHEGLHPTWQIEDWRDQPAAAREQLWKDLLKTDATRANNLAAPSLTRFSLIRMEDTEWRFLWSVPGIMMDGWSWPIVFGEVSQLMSGSALLAPANAYSSYLKWLKECGTTSEEIFWKAELAGLSAPTPVPLERPVHQGGGKRFIETSSTLDIDLVERLTRFSRQHHVTTAALAHAAWALVLARGAASEDIVFGTASNGRPNEVPGVESIVGPFTNNLPVRLAIRADQHVRDFVNDVQAKLFTLSAHQYSSMQQMQNWSEMPWNCRLFDSLLVFQNYSGNDTVRELASGVELREFTGPLHTNYPLMLVVTPGVVYDATLVHQESSCSVVRANTLLHDWKALLDKLTDPSNPSISALLEVCQLLPGTSPSHQPSDRPVDRMAPRTPLEKKIAAVWQRAFGLSDIAINENFFDLGGQSLLMLRVQQTLREELGLNLTIVQVFQHPTIASLAQSLEPPAPSTTAKPTAPPGNNPQSLAVQARNRAAAARAAIAKSRGQS